MVATGIGHLYPNPSTWIEVTNDGKPWASVGDVFVSAFPGRFQATDTSTECLDEDIDVAVSITVRLPRRPEDRWKDIMCPDTPDGLQAGTVVPGLFTLAEAVRATCHLNYDIVDRANALVGENVFVEPLFFGGIGRPTYKTGHWFSAKTKADRRAGLNVVVYFAPTSFTIGQEQLGLLLPEVGFIPK